MILDTNAVSASLGGDKSIADVLRVSSRHHLPLPVIGEYSFGLLALPGQRRYADLFRRLEAESIVLLPDRSTAEHYASIRLELKQTGRPIPENDVWIAALARQHDLAIVSNDRHFDLVPGLRRLGW